VKLFRITLSSLLLSAAAVSHAASVGKVVCNGDDAAGGSGTTFNVSFFDIGVADTSNVGGSATGSGAGKATLSTLVLHAALSTFPLLVVAASSGQHFSTCTLTTETSSGETIEFSFKNASVDSANAIASSGGGQLPRYAFTKVEMEFTTVEVRTSQTVDDGGVGPVTTGYNLQQNQEQ
jgi:type VI protein secretion system component Hcp